MATGGSLHPQDQIAHYEILSHLGSGGMGEVYLARDQTLGRSVALKVLPPDFVRSEDRLRRFVREAKAASSLNHPSIVTIHEVGESEIRSPGSPAASSAPSSSVHYIAMELVSGETLATMIHRRDTDLRTLLGYLAQAAEGLAKAHAAGIVHRDLKPSNIMVSRDGFAKVLDFGLAKLVDAGADNAEGATRTIQTAGDTRLGSVVGTVGYMSPEQVRGEPLDQRSDIFSFGCILYEAATRTRPFDGDSSVETMHRILHDAPGPIEELNRDVPVDLRRLIRRCLAKVPDKRLQSAKDLANQLREIAEEYDSLPTEGSSGSGKRAVGGHATRRRWIPAVLAGAVLAAAAAGMIILKRRPPEPTIPAAKLDVTTPLTLEGVLTGLALSPDCRFLGYGLLSRGERSLWVRQLATGSDIQVLPPPQLRPPIDLMFSPDGNYLYYRVFDASHDGYSTICDIPTLGGGPRERIYDADSRISFSPDGRKVAFRRGVPKAGEDLLVVRDLESGEERVLAKVADPAFFLQVAWSPDGGQIAALELGTHPPLGVSLIAYRLSDGRRTVVVPDRWATASPEVTGGSRTLIWLPDGKALIVGASDQPTFPVPQLWLVTWPNGRVSRLTNDALAYSMVTVSADGGTLSACRSRGESNLWIGSPARAGAEQQITFLSGDEGRVTDFDVVGDSTVVFAAVRNGSSRIHSIRIDRTGERVLTTGPEAAWAPSFVPGVGLIHVRAGADMIPHVWLMDANGGNARKLTSGSGETILEISRDGHVLFGREAEPNTIWIVTPKGGAAVRVTQTAGGLQSGARISPDGRSVEYVAATTTPGSSPIGARREIAPLDGRGPPVSVQFPPGVLNAIWAPDGTSITFSLQEDLLRNLYRIPLPGGSPQQMTHFSEGRIFGHRYSDDGKRLLITRELGHSVNLWSANADGSEPKPITNFRTGSAWDPKSTGDGKRVVFRYGQHGDQAVLIRNFR